MIANLSKGNVLLLKVDNALDYETKEKEIKQMKKETAILNVIENAIAAKNANFDKATINFTTLNQDGEKAYNIYFINFTSNGNVALSPQDKELNPTIWIQKFEKDGKVSYGFAKENFGKGPLNEKVASFLNSVEVKEYNDKHYVGVNVALNDKDLKSQLLQNGEKAYAVIKNNGEIKIEKGNIPKEATLNKQNNQEQTKTLGNPNKQKQSDLER